MTRVYLIRHAEAEGNVSRRFHGFFNSNITPNGEKQLENLAKRFENIEFDCAYSSDLTRTIKTAKAVIGNRDIELIKLPQLREINGGDWEDREWRYIVDTYPSIFEDFTKGEYKMHLPGGESAQELMDRISSAILKIVSENRKKRIVIACHGMAIKSFLCFAHKMPVSMMKTIMWCDNTAVSIMDFDSDNNITFIAENDSSHLSDDISTVTKQKWWQEDRSKIK